MVVVHSAAVQDRDGAKLVFKIIQGWLLKLKIVWADGGNSGRLVKWVNRYKKWKLEIVKRTDDLKGFKLLPHRWVVERTFGWFNRYRRLSKDYEYNTDTSETMIYIAMTHLMLRRLA